MRRIGVVVWNGSKDGPHRGLLCVEPVPTRPPDPLKPRVPAPVVRSLVVAALAACPDGFTEHELLLLTGAEARQTQDAIAQLRRGGHIIAVRRPQAPHELKSGRSDVTVYRLVHAVREDQRAAIRQGSDR